MRSFRLFLFVFWVIVALLVVSVLQLLLAGEPVLNVSTLVLVGLLVFLVLGDEFVTFRIGGDGFEIEQEPTKQQAKPSNSQDRDS